MTPVQKPHSVQDALFEYRKVFESDEEMVAWLGRLADYPRLLEQLQTAEQKLAMCVDVQRKNQETYWNQTEYERKRNDGLQEQVEAIRRWHDIWKKLAEEREEQLEALQETLALTYGLLAHQMNEDLLARYDAQLPRKATLDDLFVSNPARKS